MKRRKNILTNTFYDMLCIESIIIIAMLFILIANISLHNLCSSNLICILGLTSFGICAIFVLIALLNRAFEKYKTYKESEKYVRKHLSKSNCVEVVPIKFEPRYNYYLMLELMKRAKFYAQLIDDKHVSIFIKFKDSQEKNGFDELCTGKFTTYFEIVNS